MQRSLVVHHGYPTCHLYFLGIHNHFIKARENTENIQRTCEIFLGKPLEKITCSIINLFLLLWCKLIRSDLIFQ